MVVPRNPRQLHVPGGYSRQKFTLSLCLAEIKFIYVSDGTTNVDGLHFEWRSLISLIALGLTIWQGRRSPKFPSAGVLNPAGQVLQNIAAMAMATNKLCLQLNIISRIYAEEKREKRWKVAISLDFV